MKPTHTPGPWYVNENNGRRIIFKNSIGEYWTVAISERPPGAIDIHIGFANARLIAAAPDLLKVVTDIDEVVKPGYPLTITHGSPFHLALQDAIKKATII